LLGGVGGWGGGGWGGGGGGRGCVGGGLPSFSYSLPNLEGGLSKSFPGRKRERPKKEPIFPRQQGRRDRSCNRSIEKGEHRSGKKEHAVSMLRHHVRGVWGGGGGGKAVVSSNALVTGSKENRAVAFVVLSTRKKKRGQVRSFAAGYGKKERNSYSSGKGRVQRRS